MTRRSLILTILLSLLAGFVIGYILAYFLTGGPRVALPDESGPINPPVSGFCCPTTGNPVCAPSRSAPVCLNNGGKMFGGKQKDCSDLCLLLSQRR